MEQLWPKYTWHLDQPNTVFLTFDDGPHPSITPQILALLRAYKATATFFCIGKNVTLYPQTFQDIIKEGHTIGNHTHNHKNGWSTPNKTYLKNVLQASQHINSNLFRPPYGRIKNRQAHYLMRKGYKIVMWSLLTGDFDTQIDGPTCYNNIIQNLKSGDIIVFHDSEKAYERMHYALPLFLQYCLDHNIEVRSLPF